jgi:hypothetical protein
MTEPVDLEAERELRELREIDRDQERWEAARIAFTAVANASNLAVGGFDDIENNIIAALRVMVAGVRRAEGGLGSSNG